MLNQAKTYFSPINNKTINEFNKLFDRFVDMGEIHIRKINTKSRTIRLEKCTANIAYCEFSELCMANLAHEDYKNIANEFSILFINKVPEFSDSESDQCRRFISLIDMLYEKKCSVVILAEKPINSLCNIQKLKNEFERTASRLYEMTIITSETE
jgi:predicted ATPase